MMSYWLLENSALLIGRIEWRNMKAQWRLMKTHFPTEIFSILKIDHRTTNGVC